MEELLELRQSINSGDYTKALLIVDQMEAMSKEDKIEKIGIERSIKHIDEAELVIIVLDGSREFDELDSGIIKRMEKNIHVRLIQRTG